jgi:AraC-like DNA-binding protein
MRGPRTIAPLGAPEWRYRRIAFDRQKYGRHLLIDVAWVSELTGFIIGAPHALEFFEIMVVTRGTGWIWIEAERHAVSPGTVVFTTPGQVRCWKTEGLDGLCVFFEDSFIKDFLHDESFLDRLPYFHALPDQAVLRLTSATLRRMRTRLVAMRHELAHHRRDSLDLLRAQLHETLLVLSRAYAAAFDIAPQRAIHPVVTKFLALVGRDDTRIQRVADYAEALAVAPGHLSVLCQRYLGQRAKRVVDQATATRARRMLLYTDESIERVAASLGFADASYFSRFFRRETRHTPSAFRELAGRQ